MFFNLWATWMELKNIKVEVDDDVVYGEVEKILTYSIKFVTGKVMKTVGHVGLANLLQSPHLLDMSKVLF